MTTDALEQQLEAKDPDVRLMLTRVLGVYVCAQAGRDLCRCRCLQALLKAEAPAIVKTELQQGLSEVLKN